MQAYHRLSGKWIWSTNRAISRIICHIIWIIPHLVLRTYNCKLRRDILIVLILPTGCSLSEIRQVHLALTCWTSATIFTTHHYHWVQIIGVVDNISPIVSILAILVDESWNR